MLEELKKMVSDQFTNAKEPKDMETYKKHLEAIESTETRLQTLEKEHKELKDDYIKAIKETVVITSQTKTEPKEKSRSEILKEKGIDIPVRGE